MNIQLRIAILFAALAGGILITVSLLLYYLTNQNAFDDFYKRLEIRAILIARASLEDDRTSGQAYKDIRNQHLEELPDEKEIITPITGNDISPTVVKLQGVPDAALRKALVNGQSTWRNGNVFYYILHYQNGRGDYLVSVSARNELTVMYLAYLQRSMLISFVLATLLAFTVGLFFSKNILKPIRLITARVRNLSANNLHLRLDVKGQDEISELSATFNNMLDRLETAFETQNNFVSHASHEFNTPLTTIIGEAEYALTKPREKEQYEGSLHNILNAAERLSFITRSLLQLAQTGLTGKVQAMTRLRVDELLERVVKLTNDIMPENRVTINYSLAPASINRLTVTGNETLLELAITNIVLNACKYSGNQPVNIAIAATRDKMVIVVTDTGIGIPSQELKYIFDPFFRASNTDKFKGYGIGLPLTRNIVRIHKGELIVNSEENRGTEIKILLPLAASA